jgi:hypothetical protein
MEESAAGKTLERFSIISQEYLLQQISKLHDKAETCGRKNLTLDYVVRFGNWDVNTGDRLQSLREKMDQFESHLRLARNKRIAHNDLKMIEENVTLGAFDEGLDDDYFRDLKEFVALASKKGLCYRYPLRDQPVPDVDQFLDVLILGLERKEEGKS